jgi:hypothetical protein
MQSQEGEAGSSYRHPDTFSSVLPNHALRNRDKLFLSQFAPIAGSLRPSLNGPGALHIHVSPQSAPKPRKLAQRCRGPSTLRLRAVGRSPPRSAAHRHWLSLYRPARQGHGRMLGQHRQRGWHLRNPHQARPGRGGWRHRPSRCGRARPGTGPCRSRHRGRQRTRLSPRGARYRPDRFYARHRHRTGFSGPGGADPRCGGAITPCTPNSRQEARPG